MERLILRRIKMDDHPNRRDVYYIIFESGNIGQPLFCLSQHQLQDLLGQFEAQEAEHA